MKTRYKELDALRGFAVVLVALFHFTMHREAAHYGFNLGSTGVCLFFIISGFVIFSSLNNVSSTSEFAINRLTRLYPTYWTCVTITFSIQIIVSLSSHKTISFSDYFINLSMIQPYFQVPNLDGSYWTLVMELGFYLFMAVLFSVNQLEKVVSIGVGLIGIVAAFDFIPGAAEVRAYILVKHYLSFLQFLPLFLSGIVFYKLATTQRHRVYYYAVLVICLTIEIIPITDGDFISRPQYISMLLLYYILFTLFVTNKLNFIVCRPALFLGKISFALYLLHQYISCELIIPFLTDTHHLPFWLSAITAFVVCGIAATAVTYYVEIPLGKKLNNGLRNLLGLPGRGVSEPAEQITINA